MFHVEQGINIFYMKRKYYIYVELDELEGGTKEVPVSRETFYKYQERFGKDIYSRCSQPHSWIIYMYPDQMSTRLFNLCKNYRDESEDLFRLG